MYIHRPSAACGFLKKNQYVDLNGSESLPTIFIIASIALIVRNLGARVGVKSN